MICQIMFFLHNIVVLNTVDTGEHRSPVQCYFTIYCLYDIRDCHGQDDCTHPSLAMTNKVIGVQMDTKFYLTNLFY